MISFFLGIVVSPKRGEFLRSPNVAYSPEPTRVQIFEETPALLTLNGRGNFRIHPKMVLKLQTAISPELFESDKLFIARSKEDNQDFQIDFELLGWGRASALSHWLRTLRQNFARLVFLIAFQHVSKHARAALIQS